MFLIRIRSSCLDLCKYRYLDIKISNIQHRQIAQFKNDIDKLRSSKKTLSHLSITLNKYESDFKKELENLFESDNQFIEKIISSYNQFHSEYTFCNNDFIAPKLSNLDELNNPQIMSNTDRWFQNVAINQMRTRYSSFNKRDCIEWIRKTTYDNILNETTNFRVKPYLEESHVRSALDIINKNLFSHDSYIVKYKTFIYVNEVTKDVLIKTFQEMSIKFRSLKSHEIDEKFQNYREEIDDTIKRVEIQNHSFESLSDQLAILVCKVITRNARKTTCYAIDTIISKRLTDSEEIIHEAFKRSFEALDYVYVFKYVINPTQYCVEIAEKLVSKELNKIISRKEDDLKAIALELLNLINEFQPTSQAKTILAFLNEVVEETSSKALKTILKYSFSHVPEWEIGDPNELNEAFKPKLREKLEWIIDPESTIQPYMKKHSTKEISKLVTNFLGCVAKCPSCGAKCYLGLGHSGNHTAYKHLICGFDGRHDSITHEVSILFCWELTEEIPQDIDKNWTSDVAANTYKYGQSFKTSESKAFMNYVKKAWMNVRKPIVAYYNKKMMDRIFDKQI